MAHVPVQNAQLERFPIKRNHLIETESLGFKELERVLTEKAGQPFRNMLSSEDHALIALRLPTD